MVDDPERRQPEPVERWLDLPRDEEAPFYRSPRFRTPEATFAEIARRFTEVRRGIAERFLPSELRTDVDQLQRLHRMTFITTFPDDAGRIRDRATSYGVLLADSPEGEFRFTTAQGAPPEQIRPRLVAACQHFEDAAPWHGQPVPVEDAASTIAELFVEVLKVHPFVDGNLRAGALALFLAARRLGHPEPRIIGNDVQFAVALSYALRGGQTASMEPLTALLAHRIRR